MDEKKLTELYNNEIEGSAPDFDKLWEKIESSITPEPIKITPKKSVFKSLGAVAAFFLIITVSAVSLTTSRINEEAPSADVQQTQMAAGEIMNSDEAAAEEELPEEYAESPACDNAADGSAKLSYSDLKFMSYSETVLTCSEAPYGDSYFVEEDILREADVIIRGVVNNVYLSEGGNSLCYDMEISGSYPEADIMDITVESRSAYAMKRGREYLIPLKETENGYRTVFDHVPQIEFTADGGMVYYNGWTSDGESIIYPEENEDDYFYDRMMYSASGDYSAIIKKFLSLKTL